MRKEFRQMANIALLLLLMLGVGCSSIYDRDRGGVATNTPSLREVYTDYFDLGVAVSIASWSAQTFDAHQHLVEKHFSSLTAENEMKPDAMQPRSGQFSFGVADRMVNFAAKNSLKVRGHTLVWHNQTPDWFFKDSAGRLIHEKTEISGEDRQLVKERLESHIEAVMTHYAGKVYAWDVVNEAISDGGGVHRPNSPWYRIFGDEFMEIAFRKAHEVDPNAKLFYNDSNPDMSYKRGRTIRMLEALLADGVPIHGMGIQGHWSVNDTSIREIEQSLLMYADLGLEIHITEMDVGMDGFTEEEQAERYRELFRLFKKHSDIITSVTLWGVSDDASWRGDENPLLFDRNHQPKPAFWALVDTEKPWYVNKAGYTQAAAFLDDAGETVGYLRTGDYQLGDFDSLGFNIEEVTSLLVEKGHLVSFYEQEDFQGNAWHFVSTENFDGKAMAAQANVLAERAGRAVDGEKVSSWSPSEQPPYWLAVDLEGTYLLNRWVVRLQGTGPLAGEVEESPFNAADFSLQVSDDGVNWRDVDIVEGNISSICDRDLNLVKASHVRLHVTKPSSLEANQSLAVYEFEVYGAKIEE